MTGSHIVADSPATAPGRWKKFKRGCLRALHTGLGYSGLAALYVRLRGLRGATILSFHSIADQGAGRWIDPRYHMSPARFERQMKFLAARRSPVSLTRLIEALAAGRDLPPGTVVVTFDDGYLDHRTVVAPILAKLRIPATFFIPTASAETGGNHWVDRLYGIFQRRTCHVLELQGSRFDLHRPDEAERALNGLGIGLMTAALPERTACLHEVEDRLRPEGPEPRLAMTWNEIRELTKLSPDFEIGGHTRNHIDLSANGGETSLQEISGCAEDLRRELGAAPRHFCYPYERWTPEAKKHVRDSGFRSGMASGPETLITHRSDPFVLPRIDSPDLRHSFGFVTSGAYPDLSKALTGRA